MLGKVLKYDLKRLGQSLTPLYIFTLILSVVVLGGSYLTDINQLFTIAYGTVFIFFIVLLMAVGIGTFFLSIQKFYQNLLKDEGYLTNTLPVTKNTLILSKILSSCIFILTLPVPQLPLSHIFSLNCFSSCSNSGGISRITVIDHL